MNAASERRTPLAAGSITTVYGNFPLSSPVAAQGSTLPTSLGGLSLHFTNPYATGINPGIDAGLFYASPTQVNFQIPWEFQGMTNALILAPEFNGDTGVVQSLALSPSDPAIFSINGQGTGQGAIVDSSGKLVDASNPAKAGESIVQIYCTGLGDVFPRPASGVPALDNPLSGTAVIPTVKIGGVQAQVLFSGLAPGSVGEYQVNAQVPAGTTRGAAVPVTIALGGVVSNTVTMDVQ